MNRALFKILLLVYSNSLFCQTNISKEKVAINNYCDSFAVLFCNGDFSSAVLSLKYHSPISSSELDSLSYSINFSMSAILQGYGKILSYDFVKEKTAKDILSRRLYLVRFKTHCMKLSFKLYNNGVGWTVLAFHIDDDTDECY